MNHQHKNLHEQEKEPFWLSRTGLALLGFLAIAGFYIITEHRAHLYGVLPWLLLLLCPVLHVFGHGGKHSNHGKGGKP